MNKTVFSYVLCSNPRSGTTLLCDMLTRTGVAGRPDSFFREVSLQEWCDHWTILDRVNPTDPEFSEHYFRAMITEGRADTPVFGLRLMGPDLKFACDWLARRHPELKVDRAKFEAAFGPLRFIHLSRHDKLAEAVSYARAEQTGLWHQNADGTDMERIAPTGASGFNAQALTARMTELRDLDHSWDSWFAKQGIAPLRLTYETLADAPQKALAQVLDFIGQDGRIAASVTPGLRRLADATSADWIERYTKLHPET